MKFTQVAGLGAAALMAGVTLAVPAESARQAPGAAGVVHTVTLVTGDRVTFSSDGGRVSAEPGPGRNGITFNVTTDGGDVQVVPSDAGPLLAAGRLDERLFDVTGLVAAGYDRTAELPLIVTGGNGIAASRVDGLKWTRDLPAVNGMAARQPAATAADSWRALLNNRSADEVWLDGMRQPALDVSVPQVGAPAAWEAGYTGEGSTVAVLDSGIDDTHPDLAGQVVGRQNFTEGDEPDEDLYGHGTHVASTIAGTGAGRYEGVAPGAKLLDGKVCVEVGCAESWILAGMTWAAADQDADVVNLSLGGEDDPNVVDPIEQAVQTLSDQYGTLFVIAAGNADGVTEGAISSPGSAEAALTVGAVGDDDAMADFSRRGPTADGRLKPDITAPGVNITAAKSKDSPGPDDQYIAESGTSMATPHVAGAAAILAQRHPDWPGRRLKAALVASAQPNPDYGVYAQGGGRLDVARAVGQTVTASASSLDFGQQQWPHGDDEVRSRDVTYRNDGPAAVTLDLAVDSPTAEMFSVSQDAMTVPAGGEATVTVAVDTRVAGPDGHLGGWLNATSADQIVRTPVAVTREVESYDVTLNHLDRDGATPSYFVTRLAARDRLNGLISWWGPDPSGTVTLRVPAGHHTLSSLIQTEAPLPPGQDKPTEDPRITLLAKADLLVDRPMTVDLDARLGQPISVTVLRPSATQVFAELAAYTKRPQGTAGHIVLGTSFATMFSAQLDPGTVDDRFFSVVAGQWARADGGGGTADSPYLYSLFFPLRGRMAHGYQKTVADSELGAVRADFAMAQLGTQGGKRVHGGSTDLGVGFFGPELTFQLPFTRTEYYDPGAGYGGQFAEWSAENQLVGSESTAYTTYQAGRSYRERWNTAVFAPSLPVGAASANAWSGVVRNGNRLVLDVPMFGDGAGHTGWGSTPSSATLYRDGTKIGETDGTRYGTIDMPSDEGAYRLELHAERGAPYALSTRNDTVWTFRSGQTDAPVALPLWTVRFSPDVDQNNAVRPGAVHAVPVTVTPQSDADVGTRARLKVEASFDDGATWRQVPVVGGAAKIPHPRGNGFVSLRATAADSDGNTVTQTVVRAYRYGRP
jgi:subtilisin family serine protease